MFNENVSCVPCEIPSPGPAPLAAMLAEANDLTQKALAMVMQINNQVFGKEQKDQEFPDARCMLDTADAVAMLPGWGKSAGAGIEYTLAQYNGKPVWVENVKEE